MKSRWWQATPDGRRAVTASNGRPASAVARELCRSGAILVEERAGRLAVALDPAWQYDLEAVRRLVAAATAATIGPVGRPMGGPVGDPAAGRLVLRLPTPDGWHDTASAGSVAELLEHAAAWIRLARPPAWSTQRFAVEDGRVAPGGRAGLTAGGPGGWPGGAPDGGPGGAPDGRGEPLPAWIAALTAHTLADAADLLGIAGRHGSALEALLAAGGDRLPGGQDGGDQDGGDQDGGDQDGGNPLPGGQGGGEGGGGAPRYLDHHRSDGEPPELTHARVWDWIHEVDATRHVIVARPVAPVTQRSQRIVVFPTLHVRNPTLNKFQSTDREPIIGAFVLICSAGL